MSKKTMGVMKKCSLLFSMLQDERRQEIMQLLFDYSELSVTEMTNKLSLSRPAVSHHLKLLLDAHLIGVRREGKERYYKISLQPAFLLLKELVESLDRDLDILHQKN